MELNNKFVVSSKCETCNQNVIGSLFYSSKLEALLKIFGSESRINYSKVYQSSQFNHCLLLSF